MLRNVYDIGFLTKKYREEKYNAQRKFLSINKIKGGNDVWRFEFLADVFKRRSCCIRFTCHINIVVVDHYRTHNQIRANEYGYKRIHGKDKKIGSEKGF